MSIQKFPVVILSTLLLELLFIGNRITTNFYSNKNSKSGRLETSNRVRCLPELLGLQTRIRNVFIALIRLARLVVNLTHCCNTVAERA